MLQTIYTFPDDEQMFCGRSLYAKFPTFGEVRSHSHQNGLTGFKFSEQMQNCAEQLQTLCTPYATIYDLFNWR